MSSNRKSDSSGRSNPRKPTPRATSRSSSTPRTPSSSRATSRKTLRADSSVPAGRHMSQVAKTEAERRAKRRSASAQPGESTRSVQRQKKPTSVGPVKSSKSSKTRSSTGRPKKQETTKRSSAPKTARNREYDRKLKSDKRERPKSASAVKAAERAQRQKVERRKMYLRVALVIVIVAGLVAGAIAVYRSSLFSVEKVDVTGTHRLTKEEVVKLAAVPGDATLLRVPLKAIDERVSTDPWVEKVSVTRDWPNTIKIAVTERTPAAAVSAGGTGETWIISSGGRWLEPASAEDTETLLPIQGPITLEPKADTIEKDAAITNALALLKDMSPELRKKIDLIKTESVEKTELVTTDGVSIYIGSVDRLEEKDKIALKMLEENKGNTIYINVRVPEHPTRRGR